MVCILLYYVQPIQILSAFFLCHPYIPLSNLNLLVVMKNIHCIRFQKAVSIYILILAFAVTIHKCQGLSLDCVLMDLSDQVFSPGMACVALSRVKRLENVHLIAFKPQCVIMSTPCIKK